MGLQPFWDFLVFICQKMHCLKCKMFVLKTKRHGLGFSIICGLMLQAAPTSARFTMSLRYGFICASVGSLQQIYCCGLASQGVQRGLTACDIAWQVFLAHP